jgi:hypothetical protein
VAGVAGRGAAASALGLTADARWAPRAGWNCGVVALAAAVLDAAHYYWKLDIPGNYYGWGQMAPFCASLLFVALAARRSRRGESDAAR